MTVGELKKNLDLLCDDYIVNIKVKTFSIVCNREFETICSLNNTFDINQADKVVLLGLKDSKSV